MLQILQRYAALEDSRIDCNASESACWLKFIVLPQSYSHNKLVVSDLRYYHVFVALGLKICDVIVTWLGIQDTNIFNTNSPKYW